MSSLCHVCLAEFRPGEPWKGYPNIDPETDPFVTPGSVINNLSINTVRDVDHLRDRNNGKQSVKPAILLFKSCFVFVFLFFLSARMHQIDKMKGF